MLNFVLTLLDLQYTSQKSQQFNKEQTSSEIKRLKIDSVNFVDRSNKDDKKLICIEKRKK